MILYTIDHEYKYESEKICRIFFPAEKIIFAENGTNAVFDEKAEKKVYTKITRGENNTVFYCRADLYGDASDASLNFSHEAPLSSSDEEKLLAKAIVKVLTQLTGTVPPWGILTGVRPSKLMRSLIAEHGEKQATEKFRDLFEVSEKKTKLVLNVARAEEQGIALSKPNSFSLYVSIPFCPTRCSYCSFVSHSIEQAKKLIPDYVRLLCKEIEQTAALAKENGLRLETIYIGGGTPTSLSADDLKKITDTLRKCFDLTTVREFTVEAGRPDTVDGEKLYVLKNAGVDRISINPQTFSDSVLEAIGRRHTAKDTVEKFMLAREYGFDNINMDLIAGLPTDTLEGFCKSIDKAIALAPENITVHTLALKRSSGLVTGKEESTVSLMTEEMLTYASNVLYANGYSPYYMYRQSKSVGNLENVGWCRTGKACLYNIYMMEEIHTVLAVGGGAVTKLKAPKENLIERINNFKYPYEYIRRFDEQAERKLRINEFYGSFRVDCPAKDASGSLE